jgi:hypothetical protein
MKGLKATAFWHAELRSVVTTDGRLRSVYCLYRLLDGGGSKNLWNVGWFLRHLRRQPSLSKMSVTVADFVLDAYLCLFYWPERRLIAWWAVTQRRPKQHQNVWYSQFGGISIHTSLCPSVRPSALNTIENIRRAWPHKCAVREMRGKLKLIPDGGDSGSKKWKRRHGGAYGGNLESATVKSC